MRFEPKPLKPKYVMLRDAMAAAKAEPTRANYVQLFWCCGSALRDGNGLSADEIKSCFDEVFGAENTGT